MPCWCYDTILKHLKLSNTNGLYECKAGRAEGQIRIECASSRKTSGKRCVPNSVLKEEVKRSLTK